MAMPTLHKQKIYNKTSYKPSNQLMNKYALVDMLGQPLVEGARFMEPIWNKYSDEPGIHYGTITKITNEYYILMFDDSDEKYGSKKTTHSNILINFESIKKDYPENFL